MAAGKGINDQSQSRPSPAGGDGWLAVVGSLSALFLGGVFLAAVAGKLFNPIAFAEVLEIEGLDFWVPAADLAYFALGIEAAAGFAMAVNLRRLWVLIPIAGLVVFFMVLNGIAYYESVHGKEPAMASCGCFGHLVERSPAEAFWQDAYLLLPALALTFLGRPKGRFPWVRTGIVAVLSVGTIVFAYRAMDLPLDDLPFATRLRPGREVAEICAGGEEDRICLSSPAVAPQLVEGRHVVVVADLEEQEFLDFLAEVDPEIQMSLGDQLWTFDADPATPDVYDQILVLHAGEKNTELAFNFVSGGLRDAMRLQIAPQALLRSLYRRLPRIFVVEDGKVTRTWAPRTWDEFPPLSELESR